MSEQQLQFKIVTRFHNTYPEHRGMLLEINNSTNKGAYRKGMGLVKGASDLLFIGPSGVVYAFELKESGSRHSVDHLKCQLNWSIKVSNRDKAQSFFIFNEEQFFEIMVLILSLSTDPLRPCAALRAKSYVALSYINSLTTNAKTKTVKINYVG